MTADVQPAASDLQAEVVRLTQVMLRADTAARRAHAECEDARGRLQAVQDDTFLRSVEDTFGPCPAGPCPDCGCGTFRSHVTGWVCEDCGPWRSTVAPG